MVKPSVRSLAWSVIRLVCLGQISGVSQFHIYNVNHGLLTFCTRISKLGTHNSHIHVHVHVDYFICIIFYCSCFLTVHVKLLALF